MPRWLVELHGELLDLEEYPYWFPDGGLHAVRLGDAVFLTGPALESLPDATVVRASAGPSFTSPVRSLFADSILGKTATRERSRFRAVSTGSFGMIGPR